ncbi:glycosyltransferase family 2 protein [Pontibacter locisalis]|uniref:Glycosyltransferase family 2 protein n=1 Tax=Pontibacter locisalis TaxID=1719035 RepID=A0ABW5IPS5_9BACT
MTAFNREKYIGEAIKSVLASNYVNWELIITDDCSTDATFKIAQSYEQQDKRIKVYKNEANLGDYPNRNRAASYAKGEYLMNVDSDDLLHKGTMDKCLNLFRKYPLASFGIYCPNYSSDHLLSPVQAISKHFFEKPLLLIGPGGTIIKNKFFKQLGGFPTKYGPANDGYYNLNAASQTHTVLIPFELVYYRRHEGQEINNKYAYLYNNYLYLNDALRNIELHLKASEKRFIIKKNKRRFLTNIVNFYLETKDWSRTTAALKTAKFNIRDLLAAIFH